MIRRPPRSPLFPYTPLFRSLRHRSRQGGAVDGPGRLDDHTSRAAGAWLGAQHVEPPAPPVAARIHRRRRLAARSEEHTSELQSQSNLVCRLLLEKKKKKYAH